MSDIHSKYMQRCLELAEMGRGRVSPNPMVGSVIVYNNMIIGEGYHQRYGEAHAEVNAINSVKDKALLFQSTLYVNLEPCAHYGKTPPCAKLICEMNIPKVVIGCIDTYSEVSGRGIEILRQAGIEVIVGILEKESKALNVRFFTFHAKRRPYILLKWAETADGYIDIARTSEQMHGKWITDEWGRIAVHKMRSLESAIMVGTNTARLDNPQLNVRSWSGNNPIRITIDRKQTLPPSLHLFDGSTRTIVFTEIARENQPNVEYIVINRKQPMLSQIMEYLYHQKIMSLIIEGGSKLLHSFIEADLWDETHQYIGEACFGNGIKAPQLNKMAENSSKIGNSQLKIYKNNREQEI